MPDIPTIAPIRRQVMRVSICAKAALVARCSYAPGKRVIRSVVGAVMVDIFLFSEIARIGAKFARLATAIPGDAGIRGTFG